MHSISQQTNHIVQAKKERENTAYVAWVFLNRITTFIQQILTKLSSFLKVIFSETTLCSNNCVEMEGYDWSRDYIRRINKSGALLLLNIPLPPPKNRIT